jgi:hypothetical protein
LSKKLGMMREKMREAADLERRWRLDEWRSGLPILNL